MGRPATGQTPQHSIRVPDDDWREYKAAAGRHSDRLLRDFIRWYLRRPGAKMPARPAPPDKHGDDT